VIWAETTDKPIARITEIISVSNQSGRNDKKIREEVPFLCIFKVNFMFLFEVIGGMPTGPILLR
jgi:hypothetical protein